MVLDVCLPVLEQLSSCQGTCFGKLATVDETRSHEQDSLHQRVRIPFMQMELCVSVWGWVSISREVQ